MRRSVLIVAAVIFLVTHATNLQVPLYGTYAEIAGFGSGISAIAFSAYKAHGNDNSIDNNMSLIINNDSLYTLNSF